jgi:hypothetical protein
MFILFGANTGRITCSILNGTSLYNLSGKISWEYIVVADVKQIVNARKSFDMKTEVNFVLGFFILYHSRSLQDIL